MAADWPVNRGDTFVDPYATPANGLDFGGDTAQGGADVNRKMAQMAMQAKRRKMEDEVLQRMLDAQRPGIFLGQKQENANIQPVPKELRAMFTNPNNPGVQLLNWDPTTLRPGDINTFNALVMREQNKRRRK